MLCFSELPFPPAGASGSGTLATIIFKAVGQGPTGLDFNEKDGATLRQAFLHPQPRVNEGQILLQQGVKAAIDISDGLIADLEHICQASNTDK